jgi:hypothetical protein
LRTKALAVASLLFLASCGGGDDQAAPRADRPGPPDPEDVPREGVGELIPVPGDPARAVYQLVRMRTMSNGHLETLTRRDGSSGTSYARREIDCRRMEFRYLGEGDTKAEAEEDSPNPGKMSELTPHSISTEISEYLCAK